MELKVFIQQTEDGAKVVYPLNFDEYAVENRKYKFFLNDEAHKADYADAYSVQVQDDLKVYSLISSEIKDYLGRSGSFFAIRVVVPKTRSIQDIQSLLINIKDRYKKHYLDKSMTSLSFNDLTDAVIDNSSNYINFISFPNNNIAYCFKDNINSLNNIFQNPSINTVSCLYIFDKDKTEKNIYERMELFENTIQNTKIISCNPNNQLQYLKCNDTEIDFPRNVSSFELITTKDTKVTYKKKGKKEELTITGNTLTLQPEYIAPPKPPKPPKRPSSNFWVYAVLTMGIFGILGWLAWDFFKSEPDTNQNTTTITVPSIVKDKNTNEKLENTVTFKEILSSKDEKRYVVVTPQNLEDFEFIYNSGWSFQNKTSNKGPVNFVVANITDIFNKANVPLNDTLKQNFITELEKISGKKLENQNKENKTETVKPKEPTKTTSKEKPKTKKTTENKPKSSKAIQSKDQTNPNVNDKI